eukprot:TRINITY_DN17532_c0_g1_i4.p1 TRINITY_DN17532_c0_g1~~TRINITY_DN17532_c0_g1_i4.p1  ORF type:complete len:609 (+),score=47.81 TRINITY_DN17532_c0_g1_i4:71-1828(+)
MSNSGRFRRLPTDDPGSARSGVALVEQRLTPAPRPSLLGNIAGVLCLTGLAASVYASMWVIVPRLHAYHVQRLPGSPKHDCEKDYTYWKYSWSLEKKQYCCGRFQKPCPGLFQCEAGLLHWEDGWSELKKTWCCENDGRGCNSWSQALFSSGWWCSLVSHWPLVPQRCMKDHNNVEWRRHKNSTAATHEVASNRHPEEETRFPSPITTTTTITTKTTITTTATSISTTTTTSSSTMEQAPFSCAASEKNWKVWSLARSSWCCGVLQHTCPGFLDCRAGYFNHEKGWSTLKKDYCCKSQQRGCRPGHEPFEDWSWWCSTKHCRTEDDEAAAAWLCSHCQGYSNKSTALAPGSNPNTFTTTVATTTTPAAITSSSSVIGTTSSNKMAGVLHESGKVSAKSNTSENATEKSTTTTNELVPSVADDSTPDTANVSTTATGTLGGEVSVTTTTTPELNLTLTSIEEVTNATAAPSSTTMTTTSTNSTSTTSSSTMTTTSTNSTAATTTTSMTRSRSNEIDAATKTTPPARRLQNAGKPCFHACAGKPGSCGYCGSQGLCCRRGSETDPEECKSVKGWTFWYTSPHHECWI